MANAPEELATRAIKFVKYIKVVLPLDGFVFWVKADLLNRAAVYNALKYNNVQYNQAVKIVEAANVLVVKGSVHFATSLAQQEEETFSTNAFTFTAEAEVNDFNAVGPTMMYLTEYMGVRFAFASNDNFFQEAGLWHYHGNAVYADMATQIIDYAPQLRDRQIVSNSLPIWLSLNGYQPYPWEPFSNPVSLFPSMLLPLNQEPPFAAVHIAPESTVAIGNPLYDKTYGRTQLVKETVRITTFGLGNDDIEDFIDFVLMWAQNNDAIMGIMNQPVARDEKRGQVEFQTLAQKKTIEFEVNYYQRRARDIGRQLIKWVLIDFYVDDLKFTTESIHIPS